MENGVPKRTAINRYKFVDFSGARQGLRGELERLAFGTYRQLGLVDYGLFDVRLDHADKPWLLEVNLFCSFGRASVLNAMAREGGISDQETLRQVVSNALQRTAKA